MQLETRSLPGMEIRSVDSDNHEFEARVLTYNLADHHGTVWSPGVFNDSLNTSKPPILWEHQRTMPIGRVIDHEDTPTGLNVRARLANPDKVPHAGMVHSLLEDGLCDGFSVGFARTRIHPVAAGQRNMFGDLPAKEMATRGHLGEISAVMAPSVPQTELLALRSDETTDDEAGDRSKVLPTVDEILQLRAAKVITREQASQMLWAAQPGWREHITITHDDTSQTRSDEASPLDSDDAATLASACDSAIGEAMGLFGDPEGWRSLPDNVQEGLALVAAGSKAAGQLLDVMGIDPDDEGQRADEQDGERAASWNPKQGDYTPAQWKSACLVDTGTGDPDDKARYKLPVKTPDGTVDPGGLDSANKMLAQTDAPDQAKQKAAKSLMSMLSDHDMKPTGGVLSAASGGSRSDETVEAELDDMFARLGG